MKMSDFPRRDSNSEELLHHALLMTEVAIDLKDRWTTAEKYLVNLKSLISQMNRAVSTLQSTSKFSLQQARRLLTMVSHSVAPPNNTLDFRQDSEKLMGIIDRELMDLEDPNEFSTQEESDCSISPCQFSAKIKSLEARQLKSENSLVTVAAPNSGSNKSVNVDEKYPENWSRDSSIDLNTVVNLPSVPEDVFTCFSSLNRPKRSSSLSSLKSMRKVKLFLQRAENSDEDDASSEAEDHDIIIKGDSDDGGPKKQLGNITEENLETFL